MKIDDSSGTPPGKPDVPPLCVWRDVASDSDVVLTYETGYGGDSTLFVLPNGVALAVAWQGDNTQTHIPHHNEEGLGYGVA